jgi:4'-phosphopantetheinyl transferase
MEAAQRALGAARALVSAGGVTLEGVHVWALSPDDAPRFEGLLSDEEHARAARFRFEVDRRRHVVGVGAVRAAAGALLGDDPRALRFEAGEHGKPRLIARPTIYTNVSHSGAWVLVALCRGHELGVDVEAHRELDARELAREVFTDAERRQLESFAPDGVRARHAFFRTWARKEAVLKAWGTGLSLAASRVEVGLDDAPAREVRGPHEAFAPVRVVDLALDDAHAAAVALVRR